MKTKHLISALMLGFFCLSLSTFSYAQSNGTRNVKETQITFITTMDCGGCQKTIETKLKDASGVLEFKTDLPTKEVWVKYDSDKTNKAKLIETIGYNAKELVLAQVTFITTIDCSGCQKTVETKLADAPGVKEFKVDLPSKEVWVKYVTDKTDKATLIETIGYKATEKK